MSNVEPGTPDIPSTPTPGPTGAEPNTIDTTAQSPPTSAAQGNAARKILSSRDVPGGQGPSDAEPSNYNMPNTENPNPVGTSGDTGQPQP